MGGEGRSPRPGEHEPASSRPPAPPWSRLLGLLGLVTKAASGEETRWPGTRETRTPDPALPCDLHSSALVSSSGKWAITRAMVGV